MFLNSYQKVWKRVKLRYEKIKKYVSKEYVKDTYEDLSPNLDILLRDDLPCNFGAKMIESIWYQKGGGVIMPKKRYSAKVI